MFRDGRRLDIGGRRTVGFELVEQAVERRAQRLFAPFEIEAPHVVAVKESSLDGRIGHHRADWPPGIELE
jgi:hypothetical protein